MYLLAERILISVLIMSSIISQLKVMILFCYLRSACMHE